MPKQNSYVATCPLGVEHILAEELSSLKITGVRETRAGVTFSGELADAYRACLWSRLASRVLLTLADFPSDTAEQLYEGVGAVAWEEHVSSSGTIAVDVSGTTAGLTHTRFAAQKAKDAIVDRLRDRTGERPSVDFEHPDVRVNIRLKSGRATLSIDLSGEPLHIRGYRKPGEQTAAPLKENLAAAVLVRAGWPETCAAGGSLADPMCGSGTLLIEGAMIAADRAPGLLRSHWGFAGWLGHDDDAWSDLLAEADDRAEAGMSRMPAIFGSDIDPAAVEIARGCAARAGVGGAIILRVGELGDFRAPRGVSMGLVVTNPPYGVRMGADSDTTALYARLGAMLTDRFTGWQAAVLTSEDELARAIGLRSFAAHMLMNGAIETKLYRFEVASSQKRAEVRRAPEAPSAGAQMFANRLTKNVRHLSKWARREGVTCLRLYDADLPEYAVAVDLYEGAGHDSGRRFAHVAEYAPPSSVDPAVAEARLVEAVEAVSTVLEIEPADVAVKVRKRQRGSSQYEKQAARGELVEVAEGGLRFLVNLHDYLDTGLFLDHRPVRAMVRDLSAGKRFCNLFAYTGTASVYAAAGGATAVNTVDLSPAYIEWASRNMAANGFDGRPGVRYFETDALRWLAEEKRRVEGGFADPYGVVFCDPPTFSASKKMGKTTLDIQRDHAAIISDCAALLAEDGVLVFSTNLRTFKLDAEALAHLDVEDVTPATIPPDFARNPRIHQCFLVRKSRS